MTPPTVPRSRICSPFCRTAREVSARPFVRSFDRRVREYPRRRTEWISFARILTYSRFTQIIEITFSRFAITVFRWFQVQLAIVECTQYLKTTKTVKVYS